MTTEFHVAGLRRRAASYRRIADTRTSAEARSIYLDWAADIERRADEMAGRVG